MSHFLGRLFSELVTRLLVDGSVSPQKTQGGRIHQNVLQLVQLCPWCEAVPSGDDLQILRFYINVESCSFFDLKRINRIQPQTSQVDPFANTFLIKYSLNFVQNRNIKSKIDRFYEQRSRKNKKI